jgi:hypothetical protein
LKPMKKLSKIKMARTAQLHNCKGDVSKQWFVYFSYRNPETGKLQRFRISEGFSQYKTAEARMAYAQQLIASINLKLKSGWNPFTNENVLYKLVDDATIYQTRLLTFHLQAILNKCRPELRLKSFQSYQSHLNGFISWLDVNKLSTIAVVEFNKNHAKEFIGDLLAKRNLVFCNLNY